MGFMAYVFMIYVFMAL